MIYRFMEDGSGWVIAESRDPELEPFLDLLVPRRGYTKTGARSLPQIVAAIIVAGRLDPAPLVPSLIPGPESRST